MRRPSLRVQCCSPAAESARALGSLCACCEAPASGCLPRSAERRGVSVQTTRALWCLRKTSAGRAGVSAPVEPRCHASAPARASLWRRGAGDSLSTHVLACPAPCSVPPVPRRRSRHHHGQMISSGGCHRNRKRADRANRALYSLAKAAAANACEEPPSHRCSCTRFCSREMTQPRDKCRVELVEGCQRHGLQEIGAARLLQLGDRGEELVAGDEERVALRGGRRDFCRHFLAGRQSLITAITQARNRRLGWIYTRIYIAENRQFRS